MYSPHPFYKLSHYLALSQSNLSQNLVGCFIHHVPSSKTLFLLGFGISHLQTHHLVVGYPLTSPLRFIKKTKFFLRWSPSNPESQRRLTKVAPFSLTTVKITDLLVFVALLRGSNSKDICLFFWPFHSLPWNIAILKRERHRTRPVTASLGKIPGGYDIYIYVYIKRYMKQAILFPCCCWWNPMKK